MIRRSGSQPFFKATQIYWKKSICKILRPMYILTHSWIKSYVEKIFMMTELCVENSIDNLSLNNRKSASTSNRFRSYIQIALNPASQSKGVANGIGFFFITNFETVGYVLYMEDQKWIFAESLRRLFAPSTRVGAKSLLYLVSVASLLYLVK